MKCELNVMNNPCEFFVHEPCECRNPNACSFQEQTPKSESIPEAKKEKWYWKYYQTRETKNAKENITELSWDEQENK